MITHVAKFRTKQELENAGIFFESFENNDGIKHLQFKNLAIVDLIFLGESVGVAMDAPFYEGLMFDTYIYDADVFSELRPIKEDDSFHYKNSPWRPIYNGRINLKE